MLAGLVIAFIVMSSNHKQTDQRFPAFDARQDQGRGGESEGRDHLRFRDFGSDLLATQTCLQPE